MVLLVEMEEEMEENEVEELVGEMVVYMEGGMVRMASQGLFLLWCSLAVGARKKKEK